jgi:hypothetical protein
MRPLAWFLAVILAVVFLTAATTDVVVVSATPQTPAKTEPEYRGNTKTYKFHKRACRYYSCTNCTAEFKTREDAIAAGYRPCGTCDP